MKQITSLKRAKALSLSLFLVGLAICSFTQSWWPTIMLVAGVPLALKQVLLGRPQDALLSLVVFVGVYMSYQYEINWDMLLPILFLVAAIFVIYREFWTTRYPPLDEEDEDINTELEEDDQK